MSTSIGQGTTTSCVVRGSTLVPRQGAFRGLCVCVRSSQSVRQYNNHIDNHERTTQHTQPLCCVPRMRRGSAATQPMALPLLATLARRGGRGDTRRPPKIPHSSRVLGGPLESLLCVPRQTAAAPQAPQRQAATELPPAELRKWLSHGELSLVTRSEFGDAASPKFQMRCLVMRHHENGVRCDAASPT
jgi:hypothetical protein